MSAMETLVVEASDEINARFGSAMRLRGVSRAGPVKNRISLSFTDQKGHVTRLSLGTEDALRLAAWIDDALD
jgi:hypothetical protein